MHLEYGDISVIPTKNFFYGMKPHEETVFEIAPGKVIVVKLLSVGPPNSEGVRTVFFKVNGQTRNIEIADKSLAIEKIENVKIDDGALNQVGAPLQGLLSKIVVKVGDKVKRNDPLFVIEAMKMESTVTAVEGGVVKKIHLSEGAMVKGDDLVLTFE